MRRAQPFDPATRAHVVRRAEEVGTRLAAEEAGVAQATVRSWRHQLKGDPAAPEIIAPTNMSADGLRQSAQDARDREARANAKADKLLAAGKASAARMASGVAADARAAALSLERAARDAEQFEKRQREASDRLAIGQTRLFGWLVRAFVKGLGLGWPEGCEQYVDALLQAAADATPDADGRIRVEIPKAEALAASAAIDRVLRPAYLAEFEKRTGASTSSEPPPVESPEFSDPSDAEIEREIEREVAELLGETYPHQHEEENER